MGEAARIEQGWAARLRLGFERAGRRTLLARRERQGPLSVQRTLYPEGDLAHVYLLHPPGGVAGGDRLDVTVNSDARSQALITTPGATKFYRSAGADACQRQHLRVHDGATLEWLPQENILFPGARAHLYTRVDLSASARFIGWELHCLGRPVIAETFDHGAVSFALAIHREGRPWLLDRLRVDTASTHSRAAGLRGWPVFGTLCATPVDAPLLEHLRAQVPGEDGDCWGLTRLDDLLVARWMGDSTERARRWFEALWRALRPEVIGRAPCIPRIWNT